MRHARLEPVEIAHDALPLATVRANLVAIFEMMDQPMRHFVRHDIDEVGEPVLGQQGRIETQPAASEMRLARALATNVQPHLGAR